MNSSVKMVVVSDLSDPSDLSDLSDEPFYIATAMRAIGKTCSRLTNLAVLQIAQ
jgi:hypothetical protein